MSEKKIVKRISELMLDKKALDIKIIDVIGLTSLTDYFINCSSQSDPQTRAIKNHIQDELSKEFQIKPLNIEGYESLRWVLMDYVNIVVNILPDIAAFESSYIFLAIRKPSHVNSTNPTKYIALKTNPMYIRLKISYSFILNPPLIFNMILFDGGRV